MLFVVQKLRFWDDEFIVWFGVMFFLLWLIFLDDFNYSCIVVIGVFVINDNDFGDGFFVYVILWEFVLFVVVFKQCKFKGFDVEKGKLYFGLCCYFFEEVYVMMVSINLFICIICIVLFNVVIL